MNSSDFATLPLLPALQATLQQRGYHKMTPVQQSALPDALAGRDLIVQASTGSGKTAVFALGALQSLNLAFFGAQTLVLCPTRELADQVAQEFRTLGRGLPHLKVVCLTGGVPLRGQASSLAHGAHVVVGTPGRVLDHLTRNLLDLNALRTLVFDEADRMLEMGFTEELKGIVARCPRNRQTLFFSATYPPEIASLARPFLTNPVTVQAAASAPAPAIDQVVYAVTDQDRLEVLAMLLRHERPELSLVFVNTKQAARDAVTFLLAQSFAVLELSGDLDQRERDQAMALFSARCISVIVATDVASRGLDVSGLDLVVNLELSPDPEIHVHRIGRTGRAGSQGRAISLVSERQRKLLERIESFLDQGAFPTGELDGLTPHPMGAPIPPFTMIKLLDGKKDKLRPLDVLGALTAAAGFSREQVGVIKVTEWGTWIAIERSVADAVAKALETTPIKGKLRRFVRVD